MLNNSWIDMFMREGRSKFWDKMQKIVHIFKTYYAGENRKGSNKTWKSLSSSHHLINSTCLFNFDNEKIQEIKQEICRDWSLHKELYKKRRHLFGGVLMMFKKMAEARREATLWEGSYYPRGWWEISPDWRASSSGMQVCFLWINMAW